MSIGLFHLPCYSSSLLVCEDGVGRRVTSNVSVLEWRIPTLDNMSCQDDIHWKVSTFEC